MSIFNTLRPTLKLHLKAFFEQPAILKLEIAYHILSKVYSRILFIMKVKDTFVFASYMYTIRIYCITVHYDNLQKNQRKECSKKPAHISFTSHFWWIMFSEIILFEHLHKNK